MGESIVVCEQCGSEILAFSQKDMQRLSNRLVRCEFLLIQLSEYVFGHKDGKYYGTDLNYDAQQINNYFEEAEMYEPMFNELERALTEEGIKIIHGSRWMEWNDEVGWTIYEQGSQIQTTVYIEHALRILKEV